MPQSTSTPQPQTSPTTGDVYTTAARRDHDTRCTPCRDTTTHLTTTDTALAASTARIDRLTLGLRTARTTAVNA